MAPFNPKKVEKEWGYEIWLANDEKEDYCGKILFIKDFPKKPEPPVTKYVFPFSIP